MMAALGNHVENLHRAAIGELVMPVNLGLGEYIEIIHKDVENMLNSSYFCTIKENLACRRPF